MHNVQKTIAIASENDNQQACSMQIGGSSMHLSMLGIYNTVGEERNWNVNCYTKNTFEMVIQGVELIYLS